MSKEHNKRVDIVRWAIENKKTVLTYNTDVYMLYSEVEEEIKRHDVNTKTVNVGFFYDCVNGAYMIEFLWLADLVKKDFESDLYKSYSQ